MPDRSFITSDLTPEERAELEKFSLLAARQFRKQMEESLFTNILGQPVNFGITPDPSILTLENLEEAIKKALPEEPFLCAVWFVDCPDKQLRFEAQLIRVIPHKGTPESTWELQNLPVRGFSLEEWVKQLVELDPASSFYQEHIQVRLDFIRKRPFLLQKGAWLELSDGTWAELVI